MEVANSEGASTIDVEITLTKEQAVSLKSEIEKHSLFQNIYRQVVESIPIVDKICYSNMSEVWISEESANARLHLTYGELGSLIWMLVKLYDMASVLEAMTENMSVEALQVVTKCSTRARVWIETSQGPNREGQTIARKVLLSIQERSDLTAEELSKLEDEITVWNSMIRDRIYSYVQYDC